jgi:hypothetical protein
LPYPFSFKPARISANTAADIKVYDTHGVAAALSTAVSVSSGTASFSVTNPGTYYAVLDDGTFQEVVRFDAATGTSVTMYGHSSFSPQSAPVPSVLPGWATLVSTKTASYTAVDGDGVLVFNGATLTCTLPDPTTVGIGRTRFEVKNVNASALSVVSAGTSKTIDGAASQSVAQWGKATYISDGTQWLSI